MHFCPYCGQGNEDSVTVCMNCGKQIPGLQQHPQQSAYEQPLEEEPYEQQTPNSFGNPYDPRSSGPGGNMPLETPVHTTPPADATYFGDPNRFGGEAYGSADNFDPNRWTPPPPPVPPAQPEHPAGGKKKTALIIILALVIVLLVGGIVGVLIWRNTDDDNKGEAASEEVTVAASEQNTDGQKDTATAATLTTTTAAVTTTAQTAVVISVPSTMITTQPQQTQPPQQISYEQAQTNFVAFYASYINAMNAQTRSGIVLCSSDIAESMYSRMSLNSKSSFVLNYVDFDLDTYKALSGSRVQYIARCHSTVYDRYTGNYKDVIDARWNVVSTYDPGTGVFNVTSMTRNDSIVFGSRYQRLTP